MYRLGDRVPLKVRESFGFTLKQSYVGNKHVDGLDLRAVLIGECRPPKKGEWYISGAKPVAYRAPNDFLPEMRYHIAKLVKIERKTEVHERIIFS